MSDGYERVPKKWLLEAELADAKQLAEIATLKEQLRHCHEQARQAQCVYCGQSIPKEESGTILLHIQHCAARKDTYETMLRRAEASVRVLTELLSRNDYAKHSEEPNVIGALLDKAHRVRAHSGFDPGAVYEKHASDIRAALSATSDHGGKKDGG